MATFLGRKHGNSSGDVRPEGEAWEPTSTPLWFEYVVLAGCCFVLGFGGFGLLLAMIGHFSVPVALLIGGVAALAGIVVARPQRNPASRPARSTTLPAIAMCLIAGGIAMWNSIFIGHHVVVDNDPGVYAITGRWLATHKSLVVAAGAPWAKTGLNLKVGSAGFYQGPGGTVAFQFAHFWPTLLAETYKVGGEALMFRAPALLGALGLGAIYLVGCRLISRPWVVVAAVTALGISLPELSVTRDTFSEPSTQVLLWLGIWLLMRAYEERRVLVALLAGLAVGGTLMTHIDAVIYLVPLPLLAAIAWTTTKAPSERRSLLRLFAGVVVGAVPPVLLGTFDVQRRAGYYYANLRPQVLSLYHALAGAAVVAVIVVIVWPRLSPVRSLLTSRRRLLGMIGAWIVGVGLLLAWSLRPAGPKPFGPKYNITAGLQAADNLPIQPSRSYAELSVRWIEWYLGPVALALAIAGLALLTSQVISRRSIRSLILVAMTGPVTAAYLYKPAITPYQIWALRRFVPAALPLLVLAAGIMLEVAVTYSVTHFGDSAWPRRALVAGMAGMIAFPLGATVPLRSFQPQNDDLGLITTTCSMIGPRASVVFPPGDFDAVVLMQTLRSWCNVPAGELTAPLTPNELTSAVTVLHAQGRTLWVMAASAKAITSAVPGVVPREIGFALNDREIQGTLTQPPTTYAAQAIAIWGSSVAA